MSTHVLDTPTSSPSPYKATLFAWTVCTLGALFYCYEYLLRVTPSVMSVELMQAFHLSAAGFGSLAAFYYYAYSPMQLPVGVLMDHYGPRRLLIFACMVCSFGSYLLATQESLFVAQAGRFLVGLGSAFAFVGVLKLATIWLPPNRFALISGLATTLGMIGGMSGIILSSMVKYHGWKNTILIWAAVGIGLALLIGLVMPDTSGRMKESRESTFKDLILLCKGLLKLVKNPNIWLNGLIGCLMYLPLSAFAELWGVPYLEATRHLTDAAGLNSFVFLGWAICGPIVGFISDKIQRRRMPVIIGALGTAITFTFILYAPDLSKDQIRILLFLLGLFSSAQILVFPIAREISSAKLAATALAFTNMLVMISGMVFQPLIGKLLDLAWSGEMVNQVHVYSAIEYQYAMAALPVSGLLAAIIMYFIKETHAQVVDE